MRMQRAILIFEKGVHEFEHVAIGGRLKVKAQGAQREYARPVVAHVIRAEPALAVLRSEYPRGAARGLLLEGLVFLRIGEDGDGFKGIKLPLPAAIAFKELL